MFRRIRWEIVLGKAEPRSQDNETSKVDPEFSSERVQGYLAEAVAITNESTETAEALAFVEEMQAKIDSRVKTLRASGAYPPSLLARVNGYYESLKPIGSGHSKADFEKILLITDRVAYMDVDVPTGSSKPGVSYVKKVLRMAMAWYLNYMAQQFNNFTSNLMRLLTVVDHRLTALEEKAVTIESPKLDIVGVTASLVLHASLVDEIVGELTNVNGRILVAEFGRAQVLEALASEKKDFYGIETRTEFLDLGELASYDVRQSSVLEHLMAVGNSSLDGLVVSGIVDRGSIQEKTALLFGAKRVLNQGSKLILVSSTMEHFSKVENHMEFDLSIGRPFSSSTWTSILTKLGFSHVKVVEAKDGCGYLVIANNTKVSPLSSLADFGIKENKPDN
jgi:hypothetical protein